MLFNRKKKVNIDNTIENMATLFASMILLYLAFLSFGAFLPDFVGQEIFSKIKFYVKLVEFVFLVLFLNELDTLLTVDNKKPKKIDLIKDDSFSKKQKNKKTQLKIERMNDLLKDLEINTRIETPELPKVRILRSKDSSGLKLHKKQNN